MRYLQGSVGLPTSYKTAADIGLHNLLLPMRALIFITGGGKGTPAVSDLGSHPTLPIYWLRNLEQITCNESHGQEEVILTRRTINTGFCDD